MNSEFSALIEAVGAHFTCTICYEEFLSSGSAIGRDCCKGEVCNECLHTHLFTQLSDLSRNTITCPLCNSKDVTDLDVRRCISRAQGWFGSGKKSREFQRWEDWSVRSALARSTGSGMESIVSCPTLDCSSLFVVDKKAKKRKEDGESTSYYSLRRLLFYKAPLEKGTDKRRVWCDSCTKAFCLVCRRNWVQGKKGFRTITESQRRNGVFYGANVAPPSETHSGKACVTFKGGKIKKGDGSSFVGDNIKNCPYCQLAVDRTYGCNHITCRCGRHWCFVCEERWTREHYRCRDDNGTTFSTGDGNQECAVS